MQRSNRVPADGPRSMITLRKILCRKTKTIVVASGVVHANHPSLLHGSLMIAVAQRTQSNLHTSLSWHGTVSCRENEGVTLFLFSKNAANHSRHDTRVQRDRYLLSEKYGHVLTIYSNKQSLTSTAVACDIASN